MAQCSILNRAYNANGYLKGQHLTSVAVPGRAGEEPGPETNHQL
jgi:hypothetical protein